MFLRTVYADLREMPLSMEVVPSMTGLRLRMAGPHDLLSAGPGATRPELFSAEFEFDRDRSVKRFASSGQFLRGTDNTRFRERLRMAAHPDAVLAEESQRFSIRTAADLAAHQSLVDIGEALGALAPQRTTLKSTTADQKSRFGMVWEMEVRATKADLTERRYALQFEPYDGRLVGVVRQ